jgi:hypothetical protein
MKRKLLGTLALGALFCLACGSGERTPRPSMDAGKEGYKANFDADCPAFLAEFKADKEAADAKYKYKSIFLSGTVEREITSGSVRLVGAKGTYCSAKPFTGSAAKDAKRFKKGDKAEFLCKLDKVNSVAYFKDCSPYKEKK